MKNIELPSFYTIVVAAGKGTRLQSELPKAFLKIQGKTLLAHSAQPFLSFATLKQLIAVVPPDLSFTDLPEDSRINICTGGPSRTHSVYEALLALSKTDITEDDWVLVHDAARALIHIEDIQHLLIQLQNHPVGGGLGIRVSDTLKRCDESNTIQASISRENIWQVQTPQMFRYGLLKNALKNALNNLAVLSDITDEITAIQYANLALAIKIIESQHINMKITYPADLAMAEHYCR